jgi:hypothetical protein
MAQGCPQGIYLGDHAVVADQFLEPGRGYRNQYRDNDKDDHCLDDAEAALDRRTDPSARCARRPVVAICHHVILFQSFYLHHQYKEEAGEISRKNYGKVEISPLFTGVFCSKKISGNFFR